MSRQIIIMVKQIFIDQLLQRFHENDRQKAVNMHKMESIAQFMVKVHG